MPTLAEDLEWNALIKSGGLRREFDRLRQQIRTLTKERDDARLEATQARSQARFGPTPVVNAAPVTPVEAPAPRARPAPVVVATPAPVVEEEKQGATDDAATRFGLLELD